MLGLVGLVPVAADTTLSLPALPGKLLTTPGLSAAFVC
jgi:hypothetical protein